MPPAILFDLSQIQLDRVLYGPEVIREYNLQRHEFEMLEGVVHIDEASGRCVGYKDIRADEFWARGHIPGRPIFPGVLQIELAAQLAGFYTGKVLGWKGFLGFAGLDDVRFRMQVLPGTRLYVLAEQESVRHRRVCCRTQGIVNGNIAFEAKVTGMLM